MLELLDRRDDVCEAVLVAIVPGALVHGVDGQLLLVHQDLGGLGEDMVSKLLEGAGIRGAPEQICLQFMG